jgi:hypothetical protein
MRSQGSPQEQRSSWRCFCRSGSGARFGSWFPLWPRCGLGSADVMLRAKGQDTKLLREDQMLSMLKEALEWLNRAADAREVAGQLTDPGARKAVLELAESFDRLARAAATPAVLRRRELATKDRERSC